MDIRQRMEQISANPRSLAQTCKMPCSPIPEFEGAQFIGARIDGANLHGAKLCNADMASARFGGTDLFGADLTNVRFGACLFQRRQPGLCKLCQVRIYQVPALWVQIWDGPGLGMRNCIPESQSTPECDTAIDCTARIRCISNLLSECQALKSQVYGCNALFPGRKC